MRLLFLISLLVLMLGIGYQRCSSETYPYNSELITWQTEINLAFTDKRGILSSNGTVYLVSPEDASEVIAYRNSKILWRVNGSRQCGLGAIHQAVRHLKLTPDKLEVVYGKHSFLSIDCNTGQVTCLGSD